MTHSLGKRLANFRNWLSDTNASTRMDFVEIEDEVNAMHRKMLEPQEENLRLRSLVRLQNDMESVGSNGASLYGEHRFIRASQVIRCHGSWGQRNSVVVWLIDYTSRSDFASNLRMPSPRLRLSRTPTAPPQMAHWTKTTGNFEQWLVYLDFKLVLPTLDARQRSHRRPPPAYILVKEYAPPLGLGQRKSKGQLSRQKGPPCS
jgi:hypothetical protein